ncbi:Dynein regulatory complex subunit 6 [Entomortierella beljakovae]|nr:Dynein regulatory complex subunit 6 [Entomortierella beljakovae]
MADLSSKHRRHRSNRSTSAELTVHSPNDHSAVTDEVTPKAELVQDWTNADTLPELLDSCPQLRTIELIDLPSGATASAVSIRETDRKEHIPEQWQPLPHLTIINLSNTTISGSTLSVLFHRCPQLVKLNLSQDTLLYLSDFHIDSATTMDALSMLTLSKCHFLDGHGFKEIFSASPNLHVLDISHTNVDDTSIGALGRQCCQLKDLNMDGCQQVTDQGIRDMLSHGPSKEKTSFTENSTTQPSLYQNYNLRHLSVSDCTEITGQGIQHILVTCARLNSLEVQQPELHPESLFPHALESDDSDDPETLAISMPLSADNHPGDATVQYPEGEHEHENEIDAADSAQPWACHATLEILRIKNLNFINQGQSRFLNSRLRELSQLKVLHIGGSQLQLSILNGLGHQLENLYIDDLAREVNLDDVRWFVDHTPNLTRLWCRQLVRHSEPWKLLREAKKHMRMW